MRKLVLIACLVFLKLGFSQDLSVIYDVKIEKAPKEVKKAIKQMPDSKLTMKYSGSKTYSHLTIMGIFKQTLVFDQESQEGFLLMEISGTKMMVKLNNDQLEEYNQKQDTQPVVQEVKGKKKILSFDCKKAEIEYSDGNNIVTYYTESIKLKHENFTYLNGFPLEYQTMVNEMGLSLTASKVDQTTKIKESLFEAPKSGYQEISFEELMKGRK